MDLKKVEKELAVYSSDSMSHSSASENITIKKEEDLVVATEILSKFNATLKIVEAKEAEIINPQKASLKAAQHLFMPIKTRCLQAIRDIKDKMNNYQSDKLKKAEKKIEKIEEKVESGKLSITKAAEKLEKVTPKKDVQTETGSIKFKEVRKIKIVNEDLIPREYFDLNHVKVRKIALAGLKIPGVEVIKVQQVANTLNK